MAGTFRIGKMFGFEVNVHWSWLFIFVLVSWTFASGVLKDAYPNWTDARLWIVGSAISVLFFLSILLHEASHSVVARRFGIPVSSITLFVFGGVSNLTKEPENSKQEFWIAIVGPLTSFLLAIILGIAYFVLDPINEGAGSVALDLALINAAIGVFNLVPGFPLDGGRVLRSMFWSRNRSVLDATKLASNVGVVVAYLIMAAGVVILLLGAFLTGAWMFLIGNFLRNASAASYSQMFLDKVLRGIPVSVVASKDFIPLSPEETLAQLAHDHVLAGHGRAFPVMAGEAILGLITLTDLKKIAREDWETTTVYRAMTPFDQLKTVTTSDDLATVLALMAAGDLNQIPLVDGHLLVGLIHRADVMRYIQTRQEIGVGA